MDITEKIKQEHVTKIARAFAIMKENQEFNGHQLLLALRKEFESGLEKALLYRIIRAARSGYSSLEEANAVKAPTIPKYGVTLKEREEENQRSRRLFFEGIIQWLQNNNITALHITAEGKVIEYKTVQIETQVSSNH